MDAITLLKDDTTSLEQLFKRFEKAGDRALVEKRTVTDRIIEEYSRYAAVEEQLFYPVARATVPGTDELALEGAERHHIAKWVLSEIEDLEPGDERFDPKVAVFIEHVRRHADTEKTSLFPKVRDELGRTALGDLGDTMAKFQEAAPTHPHPTAPGNIVVGAATGVVDRVSDTVSGVAQGTVTAVQDLIALVLRRKRPKVSPTGSTVARSEARKIRNEATDLTDAAIEAARAAQVGAERTARAVKVGGERTVQAAKTGAKRTTTTARNGAKRTTTAAKAGVTSTTNTAKTAARRTTSTARTGAKRTAAAAKRS